MPIDGAIPDWLFSAVALTTLWIVMLDLGLRMTPADLRDAWREPVLMLKGLFSVFVVVPAIALIVVRYFDLPRSTEIGLVLMAVSPGAPIALRRSLDAGGHRAFAPALQIAVAALAVLSIPLSIAALDILYDGNATIDPRLLARQVFMAQLLPIGVGMLLRHLAPGWTIKCSPPLTRAGGWLLSLLVVLALVNVWGLVIGAGWRAIAAIMLTTLLAICCGHLLGGPRSSTRTALAIASAARNPGLALVVISLNGGSVAIMGTVLAYLVISALTLLPYMIWRRRGESDASVSFSGGK